MTARRRFVIGAGLWTLLGFLAPALALLVGSRANIDLGQLLLACLLAATIIIGNSTNLEYSIGGEQVPFGPDTAAWVLAILYLDVRLAMLVCVVGYMLDPAGIRNGVPWWKLAINGATSANAVGVCALAVGALSMPDPAGMLVLPIAFLVSCSVVILQISFLSAVLELHTTGLGRSILRSNLRIGPFDAFTTTLAVTVTIPFLHSLIWTAVVLALFQVLMVLAAKVSTSENLHRLKNQYLRDVFSRYVPAHVADQLAESGEEIKLGGEQREISVLFCDIRGFTSWSENVEPELVITQLNALLRGLSAAVMATDGTLDKYTGDGLMAFWGAPLVQPDHAERACRAALDMVGRLALCNAERAENGLPAFAIGIGVHSGKAVVGNIGHEDRLDYTAIGDTVNLSARIEASTKDVGSVLLISEATRVLLPEALAGHCLSVGDITVKGRSQAVQVHTIVESPRLVEAMAAWNPNLELDIELGEPAA